MCWALPDPACMCPQRTHPGTRMVLSPPQKDKKCNVGSPLVTGLPTSSGSYVWTPGEPAHQAFHSGCWLSCMANPSVVAATSAPPVSSWWFFLVPHGMSVHGMAAHGMACRCMTRRCTATAASCHAMAWHGMAQLGCMAHGQAWQGAWHGLACLMPRHMLCSTHAPDAAMRGR